jgi:heat shock protein HslJ
MESRDLNRKFTLMNTPLCADEAGSKNEPLLPQAPLRSKREMLGCDLYLNSHILYSSPSIMTGEIMKSFFNPSLLLILLITATIMACNGETTEQPEADYTESQFTLLNTEWTLVSVDGRDIRDEDFTTDRPGISFNPDELSIYGSGGCNRFTGTFTLGDVDGLNLSGIASTRMACPEMETEILYISLMDSVRTFRVDEQTEELIMEDEEGDEILRFIPAET